MDQGPHIKKPVPLILVTGFLGAGKTTLIGNMLKTLDTHLRIAVVQNEYAASGIDTRILRESGRYFEVLEINHGSIFCVCLLGSFIPSLSAFLDEKEAEILIIESTGMADPIAIAEILTDPRLSKRIYLSSIWCVVDAVNFGKLSQVNERVTRQVRVADHILVNKTDLLQGHSDKLIRKLEKLNPGARIQPVTFAQVGDPGLLRPLQNPRALLQRTEHYGMEPEGRSDITTLVLRTSRPIETEGLKQFISEIKPALIRMKGHVLVGQNRVIEIQHVFGETGLHEKENYSGQTEIVGLGWGTDNRDFGRRFHEIRKQYKV